MESFRHVLIPVDLSSTSGPTVALAGAVAPRTARLTLLHVYPFVRMAGGESLYPPPMPALDPDTRAALIRSLEELARPLEGPWRSLHMVVCEGDPGAQILDAADRLGVDLIVMGAHPRRGFDRILLGSVSEYVAPRAPCSVLAARHASAAPNLSTIVCAVDLESSSHETLGRAVEMAREVGGRVVVLHVIEGGAVKSGREAKHRQAESARERLLKLVARHGSPGAPVEPVIVFGRARDEIVRTARQRRAGLVIVGAPSGGRIERFVFGSTARRVLSESPGPVLMTRPLAGSAATTVDDATRDDVVQV